MSVADLPHPIQTMIRAFLRTSRFGASETYYRLGLVSYGVRLDSFQRWFKRRGAKLGLPAGGAVMRRVAEVADVLVAYLAVTEEPRVRRLIVRRMGELLNAKGGAV